MIVDRRKLEAAVAVMAASKVDKVRLYQTKDRHLVLEDADHIQPKIDIAVIPEEK